MRFCDLTLAYTETSGGIRTYIDAKRKYLRRHRPDDEHILVIPGEDHRKEVDGNLTLISIESPVIPGCAPYRFFWRPMQLLSVLEEARPDVVELGSFFICPWTSFRYRERLRKNGGQCLVSAYFHTDIAKAYFGAPLRNVFTKRLGDWSETLTEWGLNLAESVEQGARVHFGRVFEDCDLLFAATDPQRDRMQEYTAGDVEVVPLGVDLELFHPGKRSGEVRSRFGAGEDTILILFAGRLDKEKHPDLLLKAFREAKLENAKLILTGEGPLREDFEEEAANDPSFFVAPYESDREAFARLLASADIYATAGPHETFGLSVVEAQASGLPVVGVDAGALPERVAEGTGYLAPVDDHEAMARLFETVAPRRKEMGRAARQHVIDSGYGWESTFEKLFAAYDRAWGGNKGR